MDLISLETPPLEHTPTVGIENILIIDDDSSIRSMLAMMAKGEGYTALDLESAKTMDAEFAKREFQLVLLDINMPDANGLDVLKKIRLSYPQTQTIMVTGVSETKTAIEAMKFGAIDYITKPVNMDAVLLAIQRANDIYILKKENQEYKEGLEKQVQKRTKQIYRFADALSKKNQTIIRTNKELQQANEKLQGFLNQAMVTDKVSTLGLLSSMLIHGIANPLGVIAGITDVMQKRYSDDKAQKELKMMKNYIDQTLELVNQVRTFARTEMIQFAKVNLVDAVKNSLSLFQLLNKKNQSQITSKISKPQLWVNGSQSQLEQVLVNILQNAVHAIEEKGAIEITDDESEKGYARLTIWDSGKGISPEHMEKIFKMFFTDKSGGKGTGLGLFICKEIVEKHGGTIGIESDLGEGTKVTLRLPLIG